MTKSTNAGGSSDTQQMGVLFDQGTVRSQVSEKTTQHHAALRASPVMKRLESAQLSHDEYLNLLDRFLSFYIAAESRRVALGCFPGHSLIPDICLLSADTGIIPEDLPQMPTVTDKWGCLGMLYVLHGARFGAKMLQTTICTQFPAVPHHFIAQEQTPHQWRLIVLQMENAAHDHARIDAMTRSAKDTYTLFTQWISEAQDAH